MFWERNTAFASAGKLDASRQPRVTQFANAEPTTLSVFDTSTRTRVCSTVEINDPKLLLRCIDVSFSLSGSIVAPELKLRDFADSTSGAAVQNRPTSDWPEAADGPARTRRCVREV